MSTDRHSDIVVSTLPDGVRVVSTVLADRKPPRHVYRVVTHADTVLHECSSLVELRAFLDRPVELHGPR